MLQFSLVTSGKCRHSVINKDITICVAKKNQLDATEWYIALIICSTCFRHYYAHHQELETIRMLLPPMVCSAWFLVVGGSGAGQQATRPGWGMLHDSSNIPHPERIAGCPALDLQQPATKASHTIGGTNTHTGCNRRNGPDFGRVFLRSNYIDITQNNYIQSWTVTEILAREKNGLLWCLRTVLVSVTSFSTLLELHSYVRATVAPATLAPGGGEPVAAYSGWKSMDNYETSASVFVVLFNGFMSLTSYFDVMYRY
jgi:hypothetical protein